MFRDFKPMSPMAVNVLSTASLLTLHSILNSHDRYFSRILHQTTSMLSIPELGSKSKSL